jgi:predicted metal-dependent phosphoesterase TrpH
MAPRVDLHTHSTASDGTFTPTALMRHAAAVGLTAIALTDHDTGNGLAEAQSAAQAAGVRLIPGIEISALCPTQGELHLLGHFIDPHSAALAQLKHELLSARQQRNEKMVARLNQLGIGLTMADVLDVAQQAAGVDQPVVIGRPHIAQALVQRGAVASLKQAFDGFVGTTGAAYVPKERYTPREAIALIHAAGGVATLAHAVHLKAGVPARLQTIVSDLVAAGLDGIEVWHSDHDAAMVETCLALVRRYNLVATGGSDFHGRNKPDIRLGYGRDNVSIGLEVLEKLEQRWLQRAGRPLETSR